MLKKISLTHRLTLFFTLVIAVMAFGLGWVCLQAVEGHFEELDRATLQDKRHLIEDILGHANSYEDARQRLGEALSHHHGLYAQVSTTEGSALFASAGFAPLLVADTQGGATASPQLQTWRNGDSKLNGIRFSVPSRLAPDSRLSVAIAVDTEHHQQFLSELHRSLTLYAVLATLLSGVLGWIAAHQGMAPLRAMKNRAAGVNGQHLQQRMPVDAVPIEMADLAQELNRMLDRLEQDFERLSSFSSDLAHELRTPISNLLTQTQVTLTSSRDAATYREVLASNAEELQRLARMVSDMLFLAKTEHGMELPHKEHFFVAPEIHALLEFYEAVAEENQVHLSMKGEGAIEGDRLMFRRGIGNLLSNALRHTPKGGDVSIKIEPQDGCTSITVENTGQAIDPQALPRLFDRFYRVDPARSHPDSDGAGLGLSITKAIAEAHGGSVRVTSAQGLTKFILIFPNRHAG